MKQDRDKLVEQLLSLREQEKQVRKKLATIDRDSKLKASEEFVGKYYQEVNKHHTDYIRCLFVYGTDENCEPTSLCVSYWEGNETTFFSIEYFGHFNPSKWEEDEDKWIEISREEFTFHFNEVQKRIHNSTVS